jgi:hypothetical protein
MEISHQFIYKDLFESAKAKLEQADIPHSSEAMWPHSGGPILRLAEPTEPSPKQSEAIRELHQLISDDKKRKEDWDRQKS